MAALTIMEIIRQTLSDTMVSDADLTSTYIPVAEGVFEAITHETLTVAAGTTGILVKDMALAYLAICGYYTTEKEGHLVGTGEDSVPVYVWWEQTAFRYMASIGYAEFLTYDKMRGMYIVKGKQPRVADMMAVKNMQGDADVI